MAFSTCGDYSAGVHDLVNDPGRLRAEMDEDYLLSSEAGDLTIEARETRRLLRHLSLTTHTALVYRTFRKGSNRNIPNLRPTAL